MRAVFPQRSTAASLPRSLVLTNVSGASATFTFTARALSGESTPRVQITPSSATVAAGQQATVAVALTGTPFVIPAPGAYERQVVARS